MRATFETQLSEPLRHLEASDPEDLALIQRARGNPEEYASLYRKYFGAVYGFFRDRIGFRRENAEDLAQETFANAFAELPTFTATRHSYFSHLLVIARNVLSSRPAALKGPMSAGGLLFPSEEAGDKRETDWPPPAPLWNEGEELPPEEEEELLEEELIEEEPLRWEKRRSR